MILNLNDKNKSVAHIRTLQFYLKHGLKLKQMHRAIKFEPKEILKPHIEFRGEKREDARNDFEKDIFNIKQCFKIHGDDREFKKCKGETKRQ